jgi:hypothetical protein
VNAGTPRISYGGYQVGLAFWKGTLQGFGTAVSAEVLRDRLVGVAFGLIVYGLVEHYLWPERAMNALRARLAETLRLLADLARAGTSDGGGVTAADADSWRRRISLKVAEVQGLIESSKFESHDLDLGALEKKTADAQIVFVLLLSLARHWRGPALSGAAQARAIEVDGAVATTLDAVAARVTDGFATPAPDLQGALDGLERSMVPVAEPSAAAVPAPDPGALSLYRSLVATLRHLSPEPLATARA